MKSKGPGRPGRRERRRAETRERLLSAALALFAERGFIDTKVEDITEAADVGKGTFFNYFPSKEHVLAAVAEMQLSKIRAAVSTAQSNEKESVCQALRRLIHSLMEIHKKSPALVRSLLVAVLSSEAVHELMVHNLGRGRELLGQLLAIGQQRGEVRADLKPIELARIFQQAVFGTALLWTLHPPSPLTGWIDSTFNILWSGIRSRAMRPARSKVRVDLGRPVSRVPQQTKEKRS